MVNFLDYFFFRTYLFTKKVRNSGVGEAKWSAFLYTNVYASFFTISIICIVGLLYENVFCQILKEHSLIFWMSTCILMPVLLSFRYYRKLSIDSIEKTYKDLSGLQNKVLIYYCISY